MGSTFSTLTDMTTVKTNNRYLNENASENTKNFKIPNILSKKAWKHHTKIHQVTYIILYTYSQIQSK